MLLPRPYSGDTSGPPASFSRGAANASAPEGAGTKEPSSSSAEVTKYSTAEEDWDIVEEGDLEEDTWVVVQRKKVQFEADKR